MLNWHWIFFVNLPIGVATFLLGTSLIPPTRDRVADGVDWLGSVLVTVSLMTAVYAIVQATSHGWGSSQVLGFGALAAGLMATFLAVESRIKNPIMPLRILRLPRSDRLERRASVAVTGMYSTFFLGTLYLEHVLHYDALRTGLAFLPWTVTVGILSLGITAKLIARFGSMRVLIPGLVTVAIGLGLLVERRDSHELLPDDLLRLHRDRPRNRHVVHAAADDRNGRRARQRRPVWARESPTFPAGRRSPRPCRARHDRDQPLQGTRGTRTGTRKLTRQRLPLAFAIGAASAPWHRRRHSSCWGRSGAGRPWVGGSFGPVAVHRGRARATPRAPGRVAATAGHAGGRPRRIPGPIACPRRRQLRARPV